MTDFVKTKDIKNSWLLIDATDAIVGRLAVFISKTIRGKNKSTFTPHMDHGDFLIIKNVEKIKFTGNKFKNKKYFKHTGHPGGIKETTPEKLSSKKPEEILKLAVKRMLPGGPLAKKQMSKLKIYKGDNHPHESQNPKEIFLNQMNKKNLLRR
ncbi:MAG: 50S ribosomal protein L13 [Candidatus Pelagibacter sp.]|jgi:large subunit ribosomal protein L13|nr:50S ribosomal protein L13 [Candidatus Pelagibacter sp.]|tara:strand:- start:15018 stop:15476 length:459 start_codon:yes stop_codon:yes gene_type:complete